MKWILILAVVPWILPGCDHALDRSAHWETEREIVELTQRLKLAHYRLGLAGEGAAAELPQTLEELSQLEKRACALQQDQTSLITAIAEMEQRFISERERLRLQQRENALGQRFEHFTLADGREFQEVTITHIDDGGVSLRHQHGTARLGFKDLTPEERAFFGLEEESSLAAQARETRDAIAYEQWIDQSLTARRAEEGRAVVRATELETQARIARARALEQAAARDRLRPLAQKPVTVGRGGWSGGWHVRTSDRFYRPVYVYDIRPPCIAPRVVTSTFRAPRTASFPNWAVPMSTPRPLPVRNRPPAELSP
jgi:hypothetical protein